MMSARVSILRSASVQFSTRVVSRFFPRHRSLKVGTLNAIVGDVATHLDMTKEQVLKQLFY